MWLAREYICSNSIPQPFNIIPKGKVLPVFNWLINTPWRRVWEWMYRAKFSWPRHWLRVSYHLLAQAALPPGERAPDNVEKRKFLTLLGLGLELRPLCRPARSQSLYRLRYPRSYFYTMPACQSALQPWVSLGLLYNQSSLVRFLNKIIFYRMGLLAPCPIPSWKTRVSLLVWTLPFDRTGMGGSAGS
jgi:hypothetical protein